MDMEPNFLALKRILRYIRGTMGYGLPLFSASTSLLIACFDVTLSRSNFDAEYRDVTNDVAETLQLSSNLVKCQCTKYIEIHIRFVLALVAGGHVRVHVPSHYQFDIFTNGLPSALFSEFQESLSVCSTLASTMGGCDIFVFPKGLVHFQFNNDAKNPVVALSAFGSANAGTVSVPNSVFNSTIDSNILALSFKTDVATIQKIKAGLSG
nr:germin-like protein 9-3 [Tanacetum cinerariifolium]